MNGEKKVDEDWKRRAQLEKEQDALKAGEVPPRGEAARRRDGGGRRGGADFLTLVESLASQALYFMGAVPDPMTGQSHEDPEQAQMSIDLLGVLEEKTRGNLTPQEQSALRQVLDEVRLTFVRLQTHHRRPKGPMIENR